MAFLRTLCLLVLAAMQRVDGVAVSFVRRTSHTSQRQHLKKGGLHRLGEEKRKALKNYHTTTLTPDQVVKGSLDKLRNIERSYQAEMNQRQKNQVLMFQQIRKKEAIKESERAKHPLEFSTEAHLMNLTEEDELMLLRKTQQQLHNLGFGRRADRGINNLLPASKWSSTTSKVAKARTSQTSSTDLKQQQSSLLQQQGHLHQTQHRSHQQQHATTVQQAQHHAKQLDRARKQQAMKKKQLQTKQLQAETTMKTKLMQMATQAAATFATMGA